MKPTPPNEDHVELVIKGDDPESHRAAQETARILAAPQIARTIQERIDECQKKISEIIPSIIKCRIFLETPNEGSKNATRMCESITGSISFQCIQTERQIEYAKLIASRVITCREVSDRNIVRNKEIQNIKDKRDSEFVKWLSSEEVKLLREEKSDSEHIVYFYNKVTDEIVDAKRLEMEKNDDEADRADVQILIKCHEDIEKILTDSYLALNEELKRYESQLEGLFALVKGK